MRLRTTRLAGAFVRALALAGLLAACSQPLLNSERIERQFGTYGVDVLESGERDRVALLYSLDAQQRAIGRTLAVVRFADPLPAAIAREHAEILEGGSIGAVFRRSGWAVRKTNLELGRFAAGTGAALIAERMRVTLPLDLAMHVYRFTVEKAGERVDYATIAEIHHPDYITPEQLPNLYGRLPSAALTTHDRALIIGLVQHTVSR